MARRERPLTLTLEVHHAEGNAGRGGSASKRAGSALSRERKGRRIRLLPATKCWLRSSRALKRLALRPDRPYCQIPFQTRALKLGSVPISRSGKCGADQLTATRRYWPMEVNDVLA